MRRSVVHTLRRIIRPGRYTRGSRRQYIVRRADGQVWKGPYRDGWTTKPKEWYVFGSYQFAQTAMENHDVRAVIVRVF